MNEKEKILMELAEICKRLGWDIVIDMSSDTCFGMIIGSDEYCQAIVQGDEDFSTYEQLSNTPDDSGVLH